MKWMILMATLALAVELHAQQVIAKDPEGLIVEVKEKYGSLLLDTATVVMLHEGHFVLVHKEGTTGWFPSSFHSVRILDRAKHDEEKLAAMDGYRARKERVPQ